MARARSEAAMRGVLPMGVGLRGLLAKESHPSGGDGSGGSNGVTCHLAFRKWNDHRRQWRRLIRSMGRSPDSSDEPDRRIPMRAATPASPGIRACADMKPPALPPSLTLPALPVRADARHNLTAPKREQYARYAAQHIQCRVLHLGMAPVREPLRELRGDAERGDQRNPAPVPHVPAGNPQQESEPSEDHEVDPLRRIE